MTVSQQNEYVLPSGQSVSIQYDVKRKRWEVACWNEDSSNDWYLEFADEGKARAEFNRWRT